MTHREFISQIRSTHRLLSSDNKVNDRTILREGKNITLTLVKQQTDKRKLFSSPNLFTPVPCLQFEEAPISECCDYNGTLKAAKSILPIPKIAEGIYGPLIQAVSNPNAGTFKQITPWRYANILKLGLKNQDTFYWIFNDHLWITNPDTKQADLSAFFEQDVPTSMLYPNEDCGCKPKTGANRCENPLDQPFRCPGYLISTVSDMVSKKLLSTYHQLTQDNPGDGVDNQTKNA